MSSLCGLDGRPLVKKVGNAEEVPLEQRAKMLPDPSGYRILCAVPEVEEKTDGGIYKPDMVMQYEELTTPAVSYTHLTLPTIYSV